MMGSGWPLYGVVGGPTTYAVDAANAVQIPIPVGAKGILVQAQGANVYISLSSEAQPTVGSGGILYNGGGIELIPIVGSAAIWAIGDTDAVLWVQPVNHYSAG